MKKFYNLRASSYQLPNGMSEQVGSKPINPLFFSDKIKHFEAGLNSWSAKFCNFVTTFEHATCIFHS